MADFPNLLADHVVKLKNHGVDFAAIHAWMLGKKISDECPIAPEVAELVDLAPLVVDHFITTIVRLTIFALTGLTVWAIPAGSTPS